MLARGECEHFDFLHLPSGWVFPGHFVGCEMTLSAARLIPCSATKWVVQDMGFVFLPKRQEFLPNNSAQSVASLTPGNSLFEEGEQTGRTAEKYNTDTSFLGMHTCTQDWIQAFPKKKGGGGRAEDIRTYPS